MRGDLAYGRRIYDWWGAHSGLYTSLARAVLLGSDRRLRDEAVSRLALKEGDAVLDLACGPGPNLARLTKAVGASGRVIAFDYSERMLERVRATAAARGWRQVEALQGDAARLPLSDASVDGALSTLGLSAMSDPEAAIAEVHRCLRPGARFAVLDATRFAGAWRLLNPLMEALFVPTTNWNPSVDLVAALDRSFGEVHSRSLNGGSAFVAIAKKLGA